MLRPRTMIGSRLGPYEIVAKLGEGGMGEVYRARDAKLEREVAIKVLPAAVAKDPDLLERFAREAKAVAALSHPNILQIFDFGSADGTAYAAMELLDGETLRARLSAGVLPPRKALEIAAQIAQGLAAAHEKGIVHRDLKPENVFLARDGQVKILDFGLARQEPPSGSQSQLFAAATQGPGAPGTAPGTVLGTVGYMAPEQVRGEPADARSDVFALGVVLYEMLTGRRAFARASSVETLSAILRDEPPELEGLGERHSPALLRLIQHCLEKRPEERFQSARDLAFDLRSLASGGSAVERPGHAAAPAGARGSRLPLLLGLALALLAGALAGWSAGGRGGAATAGAAAALRPTFRQLTKLPGGEGSPALSPDGETFVYVKRDGGDLDLFAQRVDGSKAIALTPDCAADDLDPAFSPDGRFIAYHSDCGGGVFVMGATGESRRRVADFGYQPAWSPDGRELAAVTERLESPTSRNSTSELWAVAVESGERRRITEHDAMGPSWSPDGRRIAFWGLKGTSFQRDLWTAPADGSQPSAEAAVALVDDEALDWAPLHSRDGRWLYFISTRGGTFNYWRLALDPRSGAPAGEPEPVTAPTSWAARAALSADGRRLVFQDFNLDTEILRAPLALARRALAAPPASLFKGSFVLREQKLSPDGQWLVFTNEDLPQQLHLVGTDGSGYRQLTEGDRNRQGTFSPDGDWIVFQTTRGPNSLAAIHPDGGGWVSLPVGPGRATPTWSPDGATVSAFDNSRSGVVIDVSSGLAQATVEELPPLADGALFWPVSWSPDGKLLAGRATRSGQIGNVVVRDLERGTYRELPGTHGALEDFNLVFVGARHLVHSPADGLWLREVEGTTASKLYSPPPGRIATSISASRDGRWLTWIERADESDIWLMTLEPDAGGERR